MSSGGACYIYKHPDDPLHLNFYKIGKANDVLTRFKNLNTGYRNNIKNYWFIYPTNSKKYNSGMLFFIEKICHNYLKNYRCNNSEFFNILDIETTLNNINNLLNNLGVVCKLTKNVLDLTLVYDYSLNNEIQEISNLQEIQEISNLQEIQEISNLQEIQEISNLQEIQETKYNFKLYYHQEDIFNKLLCWYNSSLSNGKLILPPGIGKSYLTSYLISKLSKNNKILIIVPLLSILSDFTEVINKFQIEQQVSVVVYNSVRNNFNIYKNINYDLIIFDEAHHMLSDQNFSLVKLKSIKKLYMTATEKYINNNEIKTMHNINIFGDYIYKMSLFNSIEKGLLVDYKIYLTDLSNLHKFIEVLKNDYLREHIIMFFNSIEKSKQINEKIIKLGYNSYCINSNTSMKKRKNILNSFKKDKFSIICNVNIIGEGSNIPCIDTVIFMEPRYSLINIPQNIGRGLRLYKNKDFCMVVIDEKMENKSCNIIHQLSCNFDERINVKNLNNIIINNNPINLEKIVNNFNFKLLQSSNDLKKFINLMRDMQIYSQNQYKKYYNLNNSYKLYEFPEDEINGFKWNIVPIIDENPYTILELETCIVNYINLYKLDYKKLTSYELIIELFKLDNKIDIKLLKDLKNNNVLSKYFNKVLLRR
jgi:superfamily II DNA or RNA helicase